VPIFGYVEKHNLAYFFFILGVAITIAMVQAFVTDRPALVLDADGFVYKPVFGAVRRLAWAEVADLTSRSNKYERCVVIRTRTGQTMKIPAFQGSAEYMWYVMESCVAEAKEAHQAKAAPAADRA
jgi:hypothetical protein